MRSPLFNTVKSIAVRNMQDSQVQHSAFNSVRNRASVVAVMTHLGYTPNSPVMIKTWTLKDSKRTGQGVPVAKMPTKAGQEVLKILVEKGIVYAAELTISAKYLQNIIYEIRSIGYEVEPVKEGRFNSAYKLIK